MAVPPLFVVDSVVSCARVSVAGDERLVDRLLERRRVAVGAVDGMPSRARVHTAGWQWRRCSEAYYGDLLQVKVGLGDVGRCSVDLIYQLDNARSGQVVALVKTALVFLDRDTRRPTAVPTAFLERCARVDTQANRELGGT